MPTKFLRISTTLVLIVLTAVSIGILSPVTPAFACSCIESGPPEVALGEADAVFSGRVEHIEVPQFFSSTLDPIQVTFAVDRWWKGPGSGRVVIETARESASCGYGFVEGSEYLVYANGEGSDLDVSLCSRTQLLASAGTDISALGEGMPRPPREPTLPPGARSDLSMSEKISVAVLGALLAVGVLYGFSRMRKH